MVFDSDKRKRNNADERSGGEVQTMNSEVFTNYIKSLALGPKVCAEYNTNDTTEEVIVCTEQQGQKIVFYGDCAPLYNYFTVSIFSNSIQTAKTYAAQLNDLIGQNILFVYGGTTYHIMFIQFSNAQTVQYMDIQRVAYELTLKTIITE